MNKFKNKIRWKIVNIDLNYCNFTLRGKYSVTTDISIVDPNFLKQQHSIINNMKSMITSELKRNITDDIFGFNFIKPLNEEAKRVLIDAMILYDTVIPLSEYDKKNNTQQFKDYKLKQQLIYELRNINYEQDNAQ